MATPDLRFGIVGVVVAALVTCACGGSQSDGSADGGASTASTDAGIASTTGGTATADEVSGTAADAQGQPLAGAKITVCNPVFYDSCVGGTAGSDGRYRIDLQPNNVWSASASITRQFNGQNYCLDLEPNDASTFSSSSGAVRNFTWKLQGLRPGQTADGYASSYFGAVLDVADDTNLALNDHYIQVTLVPQGTLIDGSTGRTLTAMAGDWASFAVGDIPPGRYSVSATYVPPGGGGGALVVGPSFGQYGASTVVDFTPAQGGTCGNPEAAIHVNTQ